MADFIKSLKATRAKVQAKRKERARQRNEILGDQLGLEFDELEEDRLVSRSYTEEDREDIEFLKPRATSAAFAVPIVPKAKMAKARLPLTSKSAYYGEEDEDEPVSVLKRVLTRKESLPKIGFQTSSVCRPLKGDIGFDVTRVQTLAHEMVASKLSNERYSVDVAKTWCHSISRELSQRVGELIAAASANDKNNTKGGKFKLIVLAVVMERGGGFQMDSGCFWDRKSDGSVTVRWDGKSMHCVVTIYGLLW
eukprot:c6250_g1_i1.p1 GENE.c6250_g1_i1~~c6250_g1_i1.p1  ORF type:complete len:274 (-),score=54.61 c6250_g1_i1:40-792(-)